MSVDWTWSLLTTAAIQGKEPWEPTQARFCWWFCFARTRQQHSAGLGTCRNFVRGQQLLSLSLSVCRCLLTQNLGEITPGGGAWRPPAAVGVAHRSAGQRNELDLGWLWDGFGLYRYLLLLLANCVFPQVWRAWLHKVVGSAGVVEGYRWGGGLRMLTLFFLPLGRRV